MANEDLNIWMFVQNAVNEERPTLDLKKDSYWKSGYSRKFWRKSKTASSLRNRFRFYVRHLTLTDIKFIIQKIKTGKTHYINFEYVEKEYKPNG